MATRLTFMQVAKLLRDEGLTGDPLVQLTAASQPESAGPIIEGVPYADPYAIGDEHLQDDMWGPSYGYLQVRTFNPGRPELAQEPYRELVWLQRSLANQATAVRKVYELLGLNAWTVIREDLHLRWIPQAQAAVAALGNTQVDVPDAEVGPTGPPPSGSLVIGGRVRAASELHIGPRSGDSPLAKIEAAEASLSRSIDEADTITIRAPDPHGRLLAHPSVNEASVLDLDGILFELTGIATRGTLVTLTLTDAAAVDLNRPSTAEGLTLVQAANTGTRGDFIRRLADTVPWIQADIEPGLTVLEELAVGSERHPRETVWQAIGRVAGEIEWRRCVVANRLLVGSDAWLTSRTPPVPISLDTPGVDAIDFTTRFGIPDETATVRCDAGVWAAPPSRAVEVSGRGVGDGRWLVSRFGKDDLSSTRAVVTLTRPRPALDEPVPPPEPDDYDDTGVGFGVPDLVPAPLEVVPSAVSARGFSWPMEGRLSSPFGDRVHPILGVVRLHAGIDIGAPLGTPVFAARAGEIVHAGTGASGLDGGYGLWVDIDHGERYLTRYAHLNSTQVRRGQTVERRAQIGFCGSSGLSTAPHLHFEVRVNGRAQNPLDYLPAR